MEFQDRHVVITGGTGALGSAVVEALLAAGAWCHIPAFSPDRTALLSWADHPRVRLAVGIDLADEAQVEAFYGDCPELWASLHLAGGFAMSSLAETSTGQFRAQLRTNLETCFLCCREAVKRMRQTGLSGGQGGRIVTVAARPALEPRSGAGMAAYTASKAAVAALTQALAEEVAAEGIWINAVAPSILDTAANRHAMPEADPTLWPKPEQVAATILHLASPRNGTTRGAVIPVYGRT